MMKQPNEQSAEEMVEQAQTDSMPEAEPEPMPFPPALVRRIQTIQREMNSNLGNLIQGYLDGKDIDIVRDDVTVDLQAGTWRLGRSKE